LSLLGGNEGTNDANDDALTLRNILAQSVCEWRQVPSPDFELQGRSRAEAEKKALLRTSGDPQHHEIGHGHQDAKSTYGSSVQAPVIKEQYQISQSAHKRRYRYPADNPFVFERNQCSAPLCATA
jgi:hypothetical protein